MAHFPPPSLSAPVTAAIKSTIFPTSLYSLSFSKYPMIFFFLLPVSALSARLMDGSGELSNGSWGGSFTLWNAAPGHVAYYSSRHCFTLWSTGNRNSRWQLTTGRVLEETISCSCPLLQLLPSSSCPYLLHLSSSCQSLLKEMFPKRKQKRFGRYTT